MYKYYLLLLFIEQKKTAGSFPAVRIIKLFSNLKNYLLFESELRLLLLLDSPRGADS